MNNSNFFTYTSIFFFTCVVLTTSCWGAIRIIPDPSSFFLLNEEDMYELQRHVLANDPAFENALKALLHEANKDLQAGPYSVMQKTSLPPSQNKHDYMSLARYWWPNVNTKNHLPYIKRDCKTNPEIWGNSYDYDNISKMIQASITLSRAYFLTGDEKYAEHALKLIRTWFLDPKTKMNPNLNYSQTIPGLSTGTWSGIIETHLFPDLFDSLFFLTSSSLWTKEDEVGLQNWVHDYLEWLLNSSQGRRESKSVNNHGSWYDYQVIYYALYTHRPEIAKQHLIKNTLPKLQSQFKEDYSQPLELSRQKSFHYCVYNLMALYKCAILAEKVGVDLWQVQNKQKSVLRNALKWLIPYVKKEQKWVNEDDESINPKQMAPLLLMAARVYREPKFMALYLQLMQDDTHKEKWRLIYPKGFFK